ncbi:hypothetical protein P154DRAFT_615810 [Amniculicola lignicola CBS 123094]|uniref:MI domain-containing protein n=1 Tax=Amniculicola lignicola CBS 123094 TaxID=1392246 RepID=A0A6A5WW90_9PLEO|nr:hypothetical protein P154DRAFT_615810 [Amniculicola lignicola CBS 123094]
MRQRPFGGPKLPAELRDRVDPALQGKSGRGRNGPLNRKDRRKAERDEKKKPKKIGRPSYSGLAHRTRPQLESEGSEDDSFGEDASPPPRPAPVQQDASKPLKSILKRTEPSTQRSLSLPSQRASRAVKDKLAEDDAEIAALEKRLGIKGKKAKASGDDDGLDDLLADFGGSESEDDHRTPTGTSSKRKRQPDDEKWLAGKRRKALGQQIDPSSDDEDVDSETGDSSEESFGESLEGDSEFDGFQSEPEEPAQSRVRENPYVAPVAPGSTPTAKYVPPSMRAPPSSDTEALIRLKRQIQGLLNRLSDANLLTILREIEKIYQTNPRGYVTTTVIDLLIGLLLDETTLLDTFMILHAGFMAAVYKVIGPDFGAQMAERIVSEFDNFYQINKNGTGKQTTNLISLVAELYTFQVIGSNLVFDYIRFFLEDLSEINTELLLRMVKVSGAQLRQDDPRSLKDIVLLLQKSVAQVGESTLPVRTKFMIETINNLKNNRMKTGVAASAIFTEHTTRMKKHLGTLSTRNLKGTEPIRIGLTDIRDTEKRGKWWLVGASWRNDAGNDVSVTKAESTELKELGSIDIDDNGEIDLIQLAREQRMNTDVRRAIFITIMSAVDFKDAHVKLLKLGLKKAQEGEIPRIIVHCAGCEKGYNPYYTLLARKFCSEHKPRKAFQFALWDFFKTLEGKEEDDDHSDDDDDDDDDELSNEISLRRLVNMGKMFGTLIAGDGLPITVLKPLDFAFMKPKTKRLVEVLLITVILESQKKNKKKMVKDDKALLNIFIKVDTAPEMVPGLQYFFRKVVRKTSITALEDDKKTVRWGTDIVMGMLSRLMATTVVQED